MKVTKKTILMGNSKKRITAESCYVKVNYDCNIVGLVGTQNTDGISGFVRDEMSDSFPVRVSVNGGAPVELTLASLTGRDDFQTAIGKDQLPAAVGDAVTVTLTPDPAKTSEFDQRPVLVNGLAVEGE